MFHLVTGFEIRITRKILSRGLIRGSLMCWIATYPRWAYLSSPPGWAKSARAKHQLPRSFCRWSDLCTPHCRRCFPGPHHTP